MGYALQRQKCYIMSINSKSSYVYQLDKQVLQRVPNNPYLGVTISEDLKWGTHINKLTKKSNSTIGFLKRNLKHCPKICRRSAYIALVRSTLEYSSIIWDPHLQKDTDKLEKVQCQATRFITGDYTSREAGCVTRMLKDLNLPSLQDRQKANRLVFFYKVVEGLVPTLPCHDYYLTPVREKRRIVPKTFTDFITDNIIDRQTVSNSRCFKPVQCKTELYKQSFFPKTD